MSARPLPDLYPALASLKGESAASLSATFIRRVVAEGDPVFLEGGAPNAAYLLVEGLVKLVKNDAHDAPAVLDFIVPGRLFGMIAVLDRKPYPVTAIAARDSVCFQISALHFNELMSRHPAFAREVHRQIGDHVRSGQALRMALSAPAPARLALLLLALHDAVGSELRILREDLAAMGGITLGTVVRELAHLRRRGWVDTGWKRITIRNPAALRAASLPAPK